jgi:hypothetical protein
MLAAVVERVTGMGVEDYIARRLLRPAGVRDTYLGRQLTSALRNRVAWSIGDEAESFNILDRAPTWLSHGRGVVTTAADLYRWLRAVNRGVVLSETARRKLFSIRAPLEPGYGYAAGWFVRTDSAGSPRLAFHRGDFRSYHSEARIAPASGRISIVLTNADYRGASITESLLNKAVDSYRGGGDSLPAIVARASDAAALAGEYASRGGDGLIVAARGSSLAVTPLGQSSIDWLLLDDTVGTAARRDAGIRTMSLIDALKHGGVEHRFGRESIPTETRKELDEEWSALTRRGGRLKSYQLLGTTRNTSDSTELAVVRLKFQRDSLLFGVGWKNGTLAYTAPGLPNAVAAVVFAPSSGDEWVSVNWLTDVVRRISIDASGGAAQPTLTIHTSRGPVTYTRR